MKKFISFILILTAAFYEKKFGSSIKILNKGGERIIKELLSFQFRASQVVLFFYCGQWHFKNCFLFGVRLFLISSFDTFPL